MGDQAFPMDVDRLETTAVEKMRTEPRLSHSPAFKAKMVLDVVKEEKTIVEIAQHQHVSANQVIECTSSRSSVLPISLAAARR